MSNELYADGIGEITVTGTIVRIDLMSLSATERDASNNPMPVFRQRIIMPVDAFANAVDLMQKALGGWWKPELSGASTMCRPVPIGEIVQPGQTALNASPNFN
jgi:hypothetical protein